MFQVMLLTFLLAADAKLDPNAMPEDEVRDLNVLLQRRDVQMHLGVDAVKLREARYSDRVRELKLELQQRTPDFSDAEHKAFSQRIQREQLAVALEVLSPEQTARLQQICRQYQALSSGPRAAMEKAIELTEPQKELLSGIQDEFEADLRKMLWDFYRQSQSDLQQEMTREQREAWSRRIGDLFEFERGDPTQSDFGVLR